ncbi:MAG: nucleoside deaminase [Chloroflexota bacterium]
MSEHIAFLKEAIALSESAVQHGNQPFGALLVKDDKVVMTAENTAVTSNNVTEHAELNLVRAALMTYEPDELIDCTLYSSNEPCVMCAGAIYFSGIRRVVYGCSEKRLREIMQVDGMAISGRDVLEQSLSHQIEVVGPVLEDEAAVIHLRYW